MSLKEKSMRQLKANRYKDRWPQRQYDCTKRVQIMNLENND